MGLDIRLPIGFLFSLVGVLLAATGLAASDAETLKRSLGINIDLVWGIFLIVFGASMLFFAFRAAKARKGEGEAVADSRHASRQQDGA